MPHFFRTFRDAHLTLFALLLGTIALPLQANVFGDGNPANGIEDDRRAMIARGRPGEALQSWQMSAGTIVCDGEIRGTAVLLDVSEFSRSVRGAFLATSAHVLYDLDHHMPFEQCRFHYLALDQVPGYQASIDRKYRSLGPFDPDMETSDAGFGVDDWAFLYLANDSMGDGQSGRLPLRAYSEFVSGSGPAPDYRLIGFDSSRTVMGVSQGCRVQLSAAGDLGGGAWAGQLLDDCDSGNGASGGALVASLEHEHFLVGIRTGSHWSRERFPIDDFPSGPPPGSRWDVEENTNFSRAIDQHLINVLRELVERVEDSQIAEYPLRVRARVKMQ